MRNSQGGRLLRGKRWREAEQGAQRHVRRPMLAQHPRHEGVGPETFASIEGRKTSQKYEGVRSPALSKPSERVIPNICAELCRCSPPRACN